MYVMIKNRRITEMIARVICASRITLLDDTYIARGRDVLSPTVRTRNCDRFITLFIRVNSY